MIYKLRIISSEVEDFVRDIEIRPDQSYFDLHLIITSDLHYDDSQLASFFVSNQNWEKGLEITLFDISEGTSSNIRIMDKTHITDFLKNEKERLLYVFDYFNERILFIELSEILEDQKGAQYPRISFSKGSPPPQILIMDNNFDDPDLDE